MLRRINVYDHTQDYGINYWKISEEVSARSCVLKKCQAFIIARIVISRYASRNITAMLTVVHSVISHSFYYMSLE